MTATLDRALPAADAGVVADGRPADPDPEVPGRARRRAFTAKYKLEVLAAYDAAGPGLLRLVRATYFTGTDTRDPLASPARHPRLAELPPTLILTAEYDTLRHEMNALADDLQAKGVPLTRRQFAGVDHGFTHTKPVEVARAAISMIGDLLRHAYTDATTTTQPRQDTPGGGAAAQG